MCWATESPSTTSSSGRREKANRWPEAGASLVIPHHDIGLGQNHGLIGFPCGNHCQATGEIPPWVEHRQFVLRGELCTHCHLLFLMIFGDNFHHMFALLWTREGHIPEIGIPYALFAYGLFLYENIYFLYGLFSTYKIPIWAFFSWKYHTLFSYENTLCFSWAPMFSYNAPECPWIFYVFSDLKFHLRVEVRSYHKNVQPLFLKIGVSRA